MVSTRRGRRGPPSPHRPITQHHSLEQQILYVGWVFFRAQEPFPPHNTRPLKGSIFSVCHPRRPLPDENLGEKGLQQPPAPLPGAAEDQHEQAGFERQPGSRRALVEATPRSAGAGGSTYSTDTVIFPISYTNESSRDV